MTRQYHCPAPPHGHGDVIPASVLALNDLGRMTCAGVVGPEMSFLEISVSICSCKQKRVRSHEMILECPVVIAERANFTVFPLVQIHKALIVLQAHHRLELCLLEIVHIRLLWLLVFQVQKVFFKPCDYPALDGTNSTRPYDDFRGKGIARMVVLFWEGIGKAPKTEIEWLVLGIRGLGFYFAVRTIYTTWFWLLSKQLQLLSTLGCTLQYLPELTDFDITLHAMDFNSNFVR